MSIKNESVSKNRKKNVEGGLQIFKNLKEFKRIVKNYKE